MFQKAERIVVRDGKLLFTQLSLLSVLLTFVNMIFIGSAVLGIVPSLIYFLINAMFLGNAFFDDEAPFERLGLGSLLLITIIGLIGWAILIAFGLGVLLTTLTLCIAAALCSLANRLARYKFEVELVLER